MATEGQGRPYRLTLAVVGPVLSALLLSSLFPLPRATSWSSDPMTEPLDALRRLEPAERATEYEAPLAGRRVVVWSERGYLSLEQRQELLALADEGLERVESYVQRTLENEYGRGGRVHYFARRGTFISHTLGGYGHGRVRRPIVLLSFAKERHAPYLHEGVHIAAPDWGSLWLREGLAVFLSRRLSRWPALLRLGGQLIDANGEDGQARAYACLSTPVGRLAWDLVGREGVPPFGEGDSRMDIRASLYLLSGAFVEWLDAQCGREVVMAAYRSPAPAALIARRSGRSIERWKRDWIAAAQTRLTIPNQGGQCPVSHMSLTRRISRLIRRADFVHRNGSASVFQFARNRLIRLSRAHTLSKPPRRIACDVRKANQRSTRLIQDILACREFSFTTIRPKTPQRQEKPPPVREIAQAASG